MGSIWSASQRQRYLSRLTARYIQEVGGEQLRSGTECLQFEVMELPFGTILGMRTIVMLLTQLQGLYSCTIIICIMNEAYLGEQVWSIEGFARHLCHHQIPHLQKIQNLSDGEWEAERMLAIKDRCSLTNAMITENSKSESTMAGLSAWDEMRLKHVLHRHKREEELPEAELSKGLVSCSLPSWFKINQKLPVICQKARSTGIWYQKKKGKKEKEVKQI